MFVYELFAAPLLLADKPHLLSVTSSGVLAVAGVPTDAIILLVAASHECCWRTCCRRCLSVDVDPAVVLTSVADPDPPDPHVFGPIGSGTTSQRNGSGSCSGSGSGSFHHHAKIVRKILDSYYFVNLFDFLSLKNVASKSDKQKKLF
jgi:hypothetical protein